MVVPSVVIIVVASKRKMILCFWKILIYNQRRAGWLSSTKPIEVDTVHLTSIVVRIREKQFSLIWLFERLVYLSFSVNDLFLLDKKYFCNVVCSGDR